MELENAWKTGIKIDNVLDFQPNRYAIHPKLYWLYFKLFCT